VGHLGVAHLPQLEMSGHGPYLLGSFGHVVHDVFDVQTAADVESGHQFSLFLFSHLVSVLLFFFGTGVALLRVLALFLGRQEFFFKWGLCFLLLGQARFQTLLPPFLLWVCKLLL